MRIPKQLEVGILELQQSAKSSEIVHNAAISEYQEQIRHHIKELKKIEDEHQQSIFALES
jgi:hypothetical protein